MLVNAGLVRKATKFIDDHKLEPVEIQFDPKDKVIRFYGSKEKILAWVSYEDRFMIYEE